MLVWRFLPGTSFVEGWGLRKKAWTTATSFDCALERIICVLRGSGFRGLGRRERDMGAATLRVDIFSFVVVGCRVESVGCRVQGIGCRV